MNSMGRWAPIPRRAPTTPSGRSKHHGQDLAITAERFEPVEIEHVALEAPAESAPEYRQIFVRGGSYAIVVQRDLVAIGLIECLIEAPDIGLAHAVASSVRGTSEAESQGAG
jgi:hypothetical protein